MTVISLDQAQIIRDRMNVQRLQRAQAMRAMAGARVRAPRARRGANGRFLPRTVEASVAA